MGKYLIRIDKIFVLEIEYYHKKKEKAREVKMLCQATIKMSPLLAT
ncbi:conserved hypothetical protein [Treponema phagedenis]|uniref:Uncharacterized protein n=1 Tax=Treponema phagedenis TaxID=162 RepID=A0A0B7GTY9_TREPH|nr:hypothetical protein HMPREF9554_00667 [Treponema phagedenis F0421]CEM60440.1 conserved hypothetical protein [Treponema phagedenis]